MRQCRMSGVACLVLVLALLAPRPAAAAETIRIGYLGPLTGIFAQAGKDMLDGLKLSLEQANYQAGGRKIELIEEDTEGSSAPPSPSTASSSITTRSTSSRVSSSPTWGRASCPSSSAISFPPSFSPRPTS